MKRKHLIILFAVGVATGISLVAVTVWQQSKVVGVTKAVALERDAAKPSVVAVKKGEYVQFNSRDGREHNLVQGQLDGGVSGGHGTSDKQSGIFKANEAWRVQFKEKGTYNFYDQFNPRIVITVITYE